MYSLSNVFLVVLIDREILCSQVRALEGGYRFKIGSRKSRTELETAKRPKIEVFWWVKGTNIA